MALSRRELIAAGAGLALPVPAIARLLAPARPGGGYAMPQAFGAIPNDPRAAQGNVRAFNALAEHAMAGSLEVIIPTGIWYLAADGSPGSGWVIRPKPGHRCVIRGEGPASLLRRAPTRSASKFATMIRLWVNAGGESFDLQGFAIDGNEAEFPFTSTDAWAYQQAHCVELASTSRNAAASSLRVRDLTLSGVVADGIKIGAQCDSFEALRVMASGRTRRHRSDIQFSRLPRFATVSDCTLDAFESEPSGMVPGAIMRLSNVIARAAFDLAGPEDDRNGRLKVEASNCRCSTEPQPGAPVRTQSIFRVEGSFRRCTFATVPARAAGHNNVVRASDVRFEQCEFAIAPRIAKPDVASSLYAYFERSSDGVQLRDCRLRAMSGVSRGSFLLAGGRSPSSLLELRNCETLSKLDHVIEIPFRAAVHLSGGRLMARKSLVSVAPRAKGSRVTFDDKSGWKAPALLS